MHIGIDARFVQGPNTGVTNYLVNLLRGLSRVDKDNAYTIFMSDSNYNSRIPEGNNFHIRVNTLPHLIWKNIWLPKEIKRLKVDVMHFPAYTGTFVNVGNNVVTIHDLIHKVNPDWFSHKEILLMDLPVKLAIKKATRIIAVSESTKKDIVKLYKVKPDKITVTLEAADSSFRMINDTSLLRNIREKYSIDTDFILYVGVLFKRRNIARLFEAFSLLQRNKRIMLKLVIVGPGRGYFDLDQYIDRYNLKDTVIYLGYVPQKDLPFLYNASLFFVYPSLYEGFGLPVLEAMSCGKAVIGSNVSSLPEVIGDAGILIDPYNIKELSEAMYRLIHDSDSREDFGKKALLRSKLFSWDKMAKETVNIYSDCI